MAYAGKASYNDIGAISTSAPISAALIQARNREAQLAVSLDDTRSSAYAPKSTVTPENFRYFLQQNGVYGREGKVAMLYRRMNKPDGDFPDTDYSVARGSTIIPLAEHKRKSKSRPLTFSLNLEGRVQGPTKRQNGQRLGLEDLYVPYGQDRYGRKRYWVIPGEIREEASDYFARLNRRLGIRNSGSPRSQSEQRETYEPRIVDLGDNVAFLLENRATGITYQVVIPKRYHARPSEAYVPKQFQFDLAA